MRTDSTTGSQFRDSVATYLSSLVEKRDYAGAVKYYEAHRTLIGDTGGTWAGEMLLQVSKACVSLSDYPAALKNARIAQAMASQDGDNNLLAEVFSTIGGILRDMGQRKEAQKAFQDAESIFRRNDNLEGQSRALNLLAGLFFQQANYRRALDVLMDAVEIARKLDDKNKLAFMMANIGRIYTFMGALGDAEKHLIIGIDLSKELGDELEVARGYLSLGYIHIQRAEYEKAEQALSEAYPRLTAARSHRDEAIYLSYLGELQFRSGHNEEAHDALNRALAIAEGIATQTTMTGRILRLLAELHLRIGNERHASKFSSRAIVIMEEASNKVELGALMRIKAQLADASGNDQECRRLFQKALDLLDESGVRFEKAEALVAAGRSEAFKNRQRIIYLFRAEEYYSKNGIRPKIDEVERLIASLSMERSDRNKRADGPVRPAQRKSEFLTVTPEIERFKAQVPMLGRPDLPILLTGETGVGKDQMARYIHSVVRPAGPFVAINCASVPETLLESELFGYVRGAFTGADAPKNGLFMAACGGVLLLDEIGDMPMPLQAKLLGVLERRKITPLGSTVEKSLDIILVAATNRNLEEMVATGRFRTDLYYRLSGVSFHLTPLRERKADLVLLLKNFLSQCGLLSATGELPAEMIQQFVSHNWPGNVRELSNKVKRLEVMASMAAEGDLSELSRSLFDAAIGSSSSEDAPGDGSLFERVEQFERGLLTDALLATRGNKSQAARLLGVHEATVRTKVKRYGISMMSLETGGDAPN